jgi:hypothetical protein
MALILNIDTALDTAYISLAENERGLGYATNDATKITLPGFSVQLIN